MGFILDNLSFAVGVLGMVIEQKMDEYKKDYGDTYDSSSERYENMSDAQLEKEIERLKGNGYDAKSMGKLVALKEEYDRRH